MGGALKGVIIVLVVNFGVHVTAPAFRSGRRSSVGDSLGRHNTLIAERVKKAKEEAAVAKPLIAEWRAAVEDFTNRFDSDMFYDAVVEETVASSYEDVDGNNLILKSVSLGNLLEIQLHDKASESQYTVTFKPGEYPGVAKEILLHLVDDVGVLRAS
eukprot:Lankesteria_metandrocarpae@DN8492_c0_g1_i1.p1